jgi:hypothetical protein
MALTTKSDLWDFWDKKVTPDEKKGFRRSFGLHPIEMKSGTELFKYSTPYPFNSSRGLWSPWWNLRNAQNILLNNGRLHLCSGLGEHLSRADFPGGNPVRLARVRSAVKYEWNDLQTLFLVQLTVNAWGMFGQNAGLSVSTSDPKFANVFFIGGAYQVFVPQLLETDLSCFAALSGPDTGK